MNAPTIRPGDTVVCVNDDRAFGRLYRGTAYKASLGSDGQTVGVMSGGAFHCVERFEKVAVTQQRKVPLAVELYGANVRQSLPCGCEFSVNEQGDYTQYVKPGCKFDGDKVGRSTLGGGYDYVAFDAPIGTKVQRRKS